MYLLLRLTLRLRLPLLLLLPLLSCNPFAPSVDEDIITQDKLLGNRRTVNGLFEWFRNAYELRDSLLYGQVLAKDFTFSYYDFDKNVEINWNRDVEMRTTYNLFRSVTSISLQWNDYRSIDTTVANPGVERSFVLNIAMNQQNVFRGAGSARFQLRKDTVDGYWKVISWYDNSDF